MNGKTLADYGGPYSDSLPVEDPETQVSSTQFNLMAQDVAQLTQVPLRAVCRFGYDVTISPSPRVLGMASIWGNSVAQRPVITRIGAGHYVLVWPASFTDSNGFVEAVQFSFCQATVEGLVAGYGRATLTTPTTIHVFSFTNGGVASDLGGTADLTVWAY